MGRGNCDIDVQREDVGKEYRRQDMKIQQESKNGHKESVLR